MTVINMCINKLLLSSLLLLVVSAIGGADTQNSNNAAEESHHQSNPQRLVSPSDRLLFVEDHITSLFTMGISTLTMEEQENADSEHMCGWRRWWLDQFENAAVVRHSREGLNSSLLPPPALSSSQSHNIEAASGVLKNDDIANDKDNQRQQCSESVLSSDIHSVIVREPDCYHSSSTVQQRSADNNVDDAAAASVGNIGTKEEVILRRWGQEDVSSKKLFRTAFSMADFDRMLVTTTSIESCFDEINRQMRSSYCSGQKSHRSSSFSSAHSACPRECHPVFEVDELAMLSLYFKDKTALLLPPHQRQQQQQRPFSPSSQGVASHAETHTNLCEQPTDIGDACSSPAPQHENSNKKEMISPSSQLSIFGSRHFIDSMTLFIEYYYRHQHDKRQTLLENRINDDDTANDADSSRSVSKTAASTSHYSTSYSSGDSGGGGVNRQTFFNISSVLSECRARTNKLKAAKRKEGLRGAKLMGHKNDDHGVDDSKSQQLSKSQLIELVKQISEVAIAYSLPNRSTKVKSTQNVEKENASALLLQSLLERLPTALKEQYICFLKFFSDQPMFMPLTGAQTGSELWIMNIGAQRLAGLEKQLIPTPYGGLREPSRSRILTYDRKPNNTPLSDSDGRTIFFVDDSDDAPQQHSSDHKKVFKSSSSVSKSTKTNRVSRVASAHIRATDMAPLRQMAHRTGKTLVVRDADGRHPFIRYLQLLVKQTLFGAEAAAVDVNAQLIYEPPPKVTEETIGSARGASIIRDKVNGEKVTSSPTLAQMRFSSQPPRYDVHDTILILLSKSSSHGDFPRRHVFNSSSAFESVSSRLMVTLERSATHCHLPLKPCGKAGARGAGVGGKVEREFYSSNTYQQQVKPQLQKSSADLATSTSSSSVVTLDEAVIEMPTVTDSCLRPRIDYYTSPLIDSETIIKGKIQVKRRGGDFTDDDNEENDDDALEEKDLYEYSLERERDPNIRRVFLDEPGDMLYIPRGMIYSYRTIRTLVNHHDSENHTSQRGPLEVVALDGALFLSLSIEPLTATHDASTFASLIQSQIRETFFEIEEGRERTQSCSSGSSSSSSSALKNGEESQQRQTADQSHNLLLKEEEKKKNDEKSERKRKLDHCHDALNAVGGTTIIRQREDKRVKGDKDKDYRISMVNLSPLRDQLLLKDMGIYSSSEEEEGGGGGAVSSTQMADEASDGGFMKIKRVKRKKEKDSSSSFSSHWKSTGGLITPPFPTECFNEAHFSLLIVEALQSSIPALRRAVIRIPSKAKLTIAAENKTKTECESESLPNSLSSSSSSAYADALYARHTKWLHTIKTEMIRQFMTTTEITCIANSQELLSETDALQSEKQQEVREDPVLIQKRWVRLVLGKIFAEHFLFEHSPLWFHESTPFQERLVSWGSSGGNKRRGANTIKADLSYAPKTTTTITTDSSDSAPNRNLKEKEEEEVVHFMPRKCTMRAGDVIKLITSSASVDVQELKLDYHSSSAPHSHDDGQTTIRRDSSETFEKYKGYSVVSWKHNHALELASADMKAVVLRDIIIKNAMGTLLGENNKNEKSPMLPHLLPRPWLSSIAHRKHKYRAGTQYWHEFNTIMAVSSPEDVNEMEDAFISAMP